MQVLALQTLALAAGITLAVVLWWGNARPSTPAAQEPPLIASNPAPAPVMVVPVTILEPVMDDHDGRIYATFPEAVRRSLARLAGRKRVRDCESELEDGRTTYHADVLLGTGSKVEYILIEDGSVDGVVEGLLDVDGPEAAGLHQFFRCIEPRRMGVTADHRCGKEGQTMGHVVERSRRVTRESIAGFGLWSRPMVEHETARLWTGVRRATISAAPWAAMVVAKLWLVGGQRLTAYGSLTIDDQWFVERASWISVGKWLGPWEAHVVIKQPGYPLFIAAMHALRLPLLLAHQLLYVLAIAVLIVAVRPLVPSRRRRIWAFALLLFNPMTMNTPISARVDRSGVYPALTILLLACLVGLVSTCDRPRRSTVLWAVAASLSIGALWLVREEWLLLLPALLCGLALAIARLVRAPIPPLHRVVSAFGVACIPLTVVLGTVWVEHVNDSHYGVSITNVEQTSMSAGLGPMRFISLIVPSCLPRPSRYVSSTSGVSVASSTLAS